MTKDELLNRLEEAVEKTTKTNFGSVEAALKVAAASLSYLFDQCEKDDDESS